MKDKLHSPWALLCNAARDLPCAVALASQDATGTGQLPSVHVSQAGLHLRLRDHRRECDSSGQNN